MSNRALPWWFIDELQQLVRDGAVTSDFLIRVIRQSLRARIVRAIRHRFGPDGSPVPAARPTPPDELAGTEKIAEDQTDA